MAGEAGRSSTARNGSRLLTAKHVRRASGYYRALAPLLGILDEKNAGFFVLELVYARNAFYPEDWFLAVYPWSAPPFINFAVTRLDSAEPGLDAAQIGCLIGEKRRIRERTESVAAHWYRQRSLAAAPVSWAVPLTN